MVTVLSYDLTWLEFAAVVTSLIGVWLGTTGKKITWPWWAISSALYGWLFLHWDLYASAALQVVFIAAAIWYLVMTTAWELVQRQLEKRYGRAYAGDVAHRR